MDFKAKYKRGDYLNFFRNYLLPEDFDDQSEDVSLGFKPQHISKVTKIGEVPSLELNIYEVTHPSENDPRVSISRDAFRLLAQYGVKRALIVFNSESSSNFRLSLVTIDLKWEEGKRVQKEYSNPRRYSFFLGPETKTHTPEEYLIKQGRVKDFEDLKNRFSIEVVNKDFYTQIAVLFTQLAGGKRTIGRKSIDAGRGLLNLPSTVDDTLDKEFTVRLIGRLVFCWFLKKKRSDKNIPLLPEELLSSEAVSENKGYYHGILEPLFFQVLNTPVDSREKKYQNAPWSQIPFLNGGLFTPHHHDFYEPGPLGISKHINTLKVPDQWIKELFEVFETYNFTIDENTSVDVELSIEPEMLGRIFENLLAEINPETGETARKATGSYYTPRPIVEYMVDESLKQYLLTKTKLDEAKIKSLLTYEDLAVKLTDSERESVLVALDAVKVIDPACGSGAFPMGILQKMLLILQKVDPESEWWLERKLSQIESKLLKKELGKKLKSENVNYVHKLGIIQGSIYGVDIQPIAVEISKLRFFLSLIVDEKVNDAKENRGVEPLPNLEFKFVCTNSLIGLPKQGKSSDQLFETEDTQSINELKDLRDEYLRSYGIEKEKIQIKFLKIQKRMVEFYWQRILKPQTDLYGNKRELKKQEEPEFTRMLSSWDPFSDEPAGWFDPEWMFGIKNGFDIVIANPPYVRVDDLPGEAREIYKKVFKTSVGKYDLYYLFFEKALSICKKEGTCVFISPNKFCAADSAETLRGVLFNFINRGEILSTSKLKVFQDASNYPIISVLKGHSRVKEFSFREASNIEHLENSANQYNSTIEQLKNLPQSIVPININQEVFDLVLRLYEDSIKLSDLLSMSEGLRIPSASESTAKEVHEIVKQYQFSKYSEIAPGSYISDAKLLCILSKTSERYSKIMREKIIIAEDALEINATIDNKKRIPQGGVYFAVVKNDTLSLKVMLGLLNSSVLSFLYEALYSGMHMGGGYLRYRSTFLGNLPIKKNILSLTANQKTHLIQLVDRIYSNPEKSKEFQLEINDIVCGFYGLTKKERAIVACIGEKSGS
jgi:hypothetical protein